MSIEPILRELRRLERAGVVELDPRSLIDVLRIVELVPPGDTEALAHGLASRLTHEPDRWRQVADAVRAALRGAGPAASQRAPAAPEPAPGMSMIAARTPAERLPPPQPPGGPVGPDGPAGPDMSIGTGAQVGTSRGRWLALAGALALLGVVGLLATQTLCEGSTSGTTESATTGENATAPESTTTPETKSEETKTAEPKPKETKTAETKPAETKTAETKPAETKPEEPQPEEPKPPPEPPREYKLEELAPPQVQELRTTEVLPAELPGPAWLPAVAVLLGLFLLGAAVVAWTAPGEPSRLARVRRKRMAADPHARGVLYHVERAPPFARGSIEDAATVLGRLVRRGVGHELDVPAMVTRTLDAGGRISPVYAPSRQREHLLVFVDREHDDHPYLEGVEWVLTRWRQLGIRVLRHDYHHVPLHFEPEDSHASLTVDELGRQTEGLPLLIFSRMRQVEAARGRVAWLRQLGHWPVRAWLDLDVRPPAERPRRERAALRALAASGLPRYPFTAEGLVAASRGLAEGFPRHRLVREPPLVPMAAQDVQLMLWAATAACVPDATWVQLDAVRRHFRGFVEASPRARPLEARALERLLEWVAAEGYGAGVVGEGTRLHFSAEGRRALLLRLRAFDRQRWPTEQEQRFERRARRLLIEQLEAAPLRDAFESELRALKVAVHWAVLRPADAATVLGEFADRAVAYELRELVDDVRAAQDEADDGVWSEGQVEALGAVRGGRGARLRDLGRLPRGWQVLALAGLVTLGAGSWALGWALLPERTLEHASEVETPATSRVVEVELPEKSSDPAPPVTPTMEATPEPDPCDRAGKRFAAKTGDRPALVCIPGGSFMMGSPAEEEGRDGDERRHRASVDPFVMCDTEVTQGQYKAVMGKNPSDCDYGCGGSLPVQNVSWNEACAYMEKLTERENETRAKEGQPALTQCYEKRGSSWAWKDHGCTGFRLPTESEWEYAARARTTTAHFFDKVADAKLDDYAWFGDNAEGKVHPVGTKKRNPWGLYDIYGNVWEWCWDWYAEYKASPKKNDSGPENGVDRVLRGGSAWNVSWDLRSALRLGLSPTDRGGFNGFRCVRAPRPSLEP